MKTLIANRTDTDRYKNLLTVTATAFNGKARLTGQVNGKTVREERVVAVSSQERLESLSDNLLNLLHRAATV